MAIKFSIREHCKFDSTKLVDGPITCRVLKVAKNDKTPKYNGWLIKDFNYEEGLMKQKIQHIIDEKYQSIEFQNDFKDEEKALQE